MTDDAVAAITEETRAAEAAAIAAIEAAGVSVSVTPGAHQKLEKAFAEKQARDAEARKSFHPAFQREQAALHEAEAERIRLAQPDPRIVLRAAHRNRAETQATVARLETAVRRARAFFESVEGRRAGIAAAIASDAEARSVRLRQALEAGEAAPVVDVDNAATESLRQAEREAAIALDALRPLEGELKAAQDLLVQRGNGVRRCATAVLVDIAAETANEILEDVRALADRRHTLSSLAREITDQDRRLGLRRAFPPQIARAIDGEDPQLTGLRPVSTTNWSATFRELCEPPEAVPPAAA
jgi:hypothetical protein